jgi:hypothetical protein
LPTRRVRGRVADEMAEEDKKPPLKDEKVIGNGSFGVVFQATMADTGEVVAVKKVLQDKRFKVLVLGRPILLARIRAHIIAKFWLQRWKLVCAQHVRRASARRHTCVLHQVLADRVRGGCVCAEPRAADHEAIEA